MHSIVQLNPIAAAARQAIDDYLGGRQIPGRLRGSIFLAVESRLTKGLEPGLREEHKALLDKWADTRLANRRG